MISTQLLSEVLGFYIDNCWNDGNLVVWKEDGMSDINIYELAHKCKEWIFTKGYVVISGLSCKNYPSKEVEYDCIIEDFHSYYEDSKPFIQFFADTEAEAIFKACEYILDNKENK